MSFMKSFLLLIAMGFTCLAGTAQSVAINNDGATAHASAALDIKSNNRGLLIPRLTTAERTAIATPAKGLLVFDTDSNNFWFHDGAGWSNLAAGNGFSLPFAAAATSANDVFAITNNGAGAALYARNDGGKAASFVNTNNNNIESSLLEVVTNGRGNLSDNTKGNAAFFTITNDQSIGAAVRAKVHTVFSNFGAAAVFGESAGAGGNAGLFYTSNPNGNGSTLVALTAGNGNAITATAKKGGNGVESSIEGAGTAIYGWVPNFGTGRAARFINYNISNLNTVLHVESRGLGNLAVFRSGDPAVNVARIGSNGKAFFNGGTQNSGADLAEAFDVTGDINSYEPGDVLVIATDKDRAVEKSAQPYSNLVAGVYATKPGVLLTEEHIDNDLHDKIPMGVIGVIPTKVSLEGGTIKRGDMLVTSSLRGVAMKADPDKVKPGQVIGKALQDFTGAAPGKINVLVNVK